jgi:beta-glucanase (GH16 family)
MPLRLSAVVCLVAGMLGCIGGTAQAAWQLVWSDEFNQPDGSSPNPTNWTFETGNNGGWGNSELEYYTSRTNNAVIVNGQLVITAVQESYSNFNYTSARMKTQGKWSWTYGRMEASIKLPRGQGIWPAFWMLGANIGPPGVGWPTCGEIDIMENIGKTNNNEQAKAYGTIHGPQGGGDYNGGAGVGGVYTLPGGGALADNFHLYAIEWTTNQIKWFVDSNLYFTATPASLPGGGTWVFTNSQFLLLNVAVGGNWPGYPSNYTVFPQQMLVDYVRVYAQAAATNAPDAPTGLTASPGNGKVYLAWNASTNGPTGYNVKRATVSGGPYSNVGSATANTFTDTTAANCSTYYYVVTATNSFGESTNSNEAAASLGTFALAVNSGGSAAGQFIADAYVSGGSASTSALTIDTSAVTAPAPQAVYQSERNGNFTYNFTGLTAGQSYKVRLHFAEFYWTTVSQRIFNVFINGKNVLTNFDIIAVAGAPEKANIQEFTTVPTSTNTIFIQYTTVKDNAKSSGIELLVTRPSAPPMVTANAGDSMVALNWNPSTGGATYNVWRSLTSTGPYSLVTKLLTTTNYLDTGLTNGTTYFYVVSAVNAGCESTNSAFVSATPVCSPPPTPTAGNDGPIWAGMTLNLTASTVPGATYSWSGPNGFSSSDQNPSIATATTNDSGVYSAVATTGSCSSPAGTTIVTVNPLPSLSVETGSGNIMLSWPTGTLVAATNISGPWSEVSNATNPWPVQTIQPQEFYRLKLQ